MMRHSVEIAEIFQKFREINFYHLINRRNVISRNYFAGRSKFLLFPHCVWEKDSEINNYEDSTLKL